MAFRGRGKERGLGARYVYDGAVVCLPRARPVCTPSRWTSPRCVLRTEVYQVDVVLARPRPSVPKEDVLHLHVVVDAALDVDAFQKAKISP